MILKMIRIRIRPKKIILRKNPIAIKHKIQTKKIKRKTTRMKYSENKVRSRRFIRGRTTNKEEEEHNTNNNE